MSEWILVKDRLPEDSVTVLAYSKGIGWVLCYYIYEVGKWYYDNIDSLETVNITHWQPLPEQPDEK